MLANAIITSSKSDAHVSRALTLSASISRARWQNFCANSQLYSSIKDSALSRMSSMLNLESEASGRTPSKSEQTLLIYNLFRCRRTLKRKSLRSNNSNAMAYGAKHQIEEKEQKLKLKVTYLSFSQAFSSFLKEFSAFPSLKGKN